MGTHVSLIRCGNGVGLRGKLGKGDGGHVESLVA
jgi:hypothetical protein